MATDSIHTVVDAVNSSKLDSLQSLFSPELHSTVTAALGDMAESIKNVKYTVNQSVQEGNLLAFTYSATGTSSAGKAGSWTGSGIATLDGNTIVELQVQEDFIARLIATGATGSIATAAHPSATGTWTGSAHGLTITLVLKQSGKNITGTAAISGFPGTHPVTGENDYPHNPNVTVNANVAGLEAEFEGDFDGSNKVNGKLKISGFESIDVTITRK
jgi:hypothetical protein